MKGNKWVSITLVVLLAFCIAGFAIAQKQRNNAARQAQQLRGGQELPGEVIEKIGQRLGIEPDRMEQLMRIKRQTTKEEIRLKADLEIAKMDLADTIRSFQSSDQQVKRAAEKVAQLQGKAIEIKIQALLEAKKFLTPEQYKKVLQMIWMKNHQPPNGPMPGGMMMQHPGFPGMQPPGSGQPRFGGMERPQGFDEQAPPPNYPGMQQRQRDNQQVPKSDND